MVYLSSLGITARFEGHNLVWVERSKAFTSSCVLIQVQRKNEGPIPSTTPQPIKKNKSPTCQIQWLHCLTGCREERTFHCIFWITVMAYQNNRTKEGKKKLHKTPCNAKASPKSPFFELSVNARDFAEILSRHRSKRPPGHFSESLDHGWYIDMMSYRMGGEDCICFSFEKHSCWFSRNCLLGILKTNWTKRFLPACSGRLAAEAAQPIETAWRLTKDPNGYGSKSNGMTYMLIFTV